MCGDNICPPTLAPFVWPCPWPLDLDALNQAARHVIGTHDFTSFAASDPDLTARTLAESGAPHLDSEMWDEAPKEAVIPAEAGHGLTGSTEGEDQPHTQRDCHSDPEHREGEESPHFATADPDRPESGAPHLDSEMWDANATKTPIRTITHSCWHIENGLFLYRVAADGFLHHMVRNLVGTFVQAGAHRLAPASIPAILAARNRSAAGPTAPASGLFLVSVNYRAATNNQQPTTNNSL
jgi:tRNA U38,U39,U40 pseudouridine synthase TruA